MYYRDMGSGQLLGEGFRSPNGHRDPRIMGTPKTSRTPKHAGPQFPWEQGAGLWLGHEGFRGHFVSSMLGSFRGGFGFPAASSPAQLSVPAPYRFGGGGPHGPLGLGTSTLPLPARLCPGDWGELGAPHPAEPPPPLPPLPPRCGAGPAAGRYDSAAGRFGKEGARHREGGGGPQYPNLPFPVPIGLNLDPKGTVRTVLSPPPRPPAVSCDGA